MLLGRWIKKCRTNTAQMTAPQIAALQALGIDMEPVFPAAALEPTDSVDDEEGWAQPDLPGVPW